MDFRPPELGDIAATRAALRPYLAETPVVDWTGGELDDLMGHATHVALKLELLQRSGSFKARGAFAGILGLDVDELRRGVTTVSSGNHAIATAYAARQLGTSAKVVVLSSANPARLERCRRFGGEVVVADTGAAAFKLAERMVLVEGRTLIHPYEGRHVALGTGTLGMEFSTQAGDLDAIVVPIGGGGLCAGVATAFKQLQPGCRVYGVEPVGADVMYRSLLAGQPTTSLPIDTIADSLGAPFTCPYTFELCRRTLDDVVLVDDDEIRFAMALIFREMKQAVEPASAAATAALIGPLRHELAGKKVGIILCGANIDFRTYANHVSSSHELPQPARVPRQALSAHRERARTV